MGLFIIRISMWFSNHTCQHAASYVITFLLCTQIKQIDCREHREKEGTTSSIAILVIIANTKTKLEQHCVYTKFQTPTMHDLESETQSTFAAAAEPILKVVFNFFFYNKHLQMPFLKHAIYFIKLHMTIASVQLIY